MPPPRPRGVGYSTGSAASRPCPNPPMSERQQMALLLQMTADLNTEAPRTHVKKNEHKKCEDSHSHPHSEDASTSEKHDTQEPNRDKTSTEESNSENKSEHYNVGNADAPSTSNQAKRAFSDAEEDFDDCDDVSKKKKRKESDSKELSKTISNMRLPGRAEKSVKQTSVAKSSPNSSKAAGSAEKEQTESVGKAGFSKTSFETDGDDDENKISDSLYSGGLKVPPLKIVIPQQNCSIDTDGNVSRTGKINTSRNAALPYVVSSNNDSNERDAQCSSPHESPLKINTIGSIIDEKNMKLLNEEKNLHRVLRSSHRSGLTSAERSSNNSSPQMQSSSPSPASSHANETTDGKITFTNINASPLQQSQTYEHENIVNLPSPSTSSTSSSKDVHSSSADLHPRKRKIRSKNDDNHKGSSTSHHSGNIEPTSNISESHTHDYPFTNCFQMYLNIRKQNEKKRRNMDPIRPRPPQGYNEYLLNKRTYLLAKNNVKAEVDVPGGLPPKMREIFRMQQKERHQLFQRHTVEREKLCLNVEQEIIRVHTKLARNSSCQTLPYSVCTMLKDEEVYNISTPEQEDKDKTARNRSNGRLLLGWLQDVDDKWDKIKEAMVLRHHNEAESLHAVQMMDWDIALKKFNLSDYKSTNPVNREHVPIVHVSDDFDLLPA